VPIDRGQQAISSFRFIRTEPARRVRERGLVGGAETMGLRSAPSSLGWRQCLLHLSRLRLIHVKFRCSGCAAEFHRRGIGATLR